ncbi:unnamed protein product [Lactuca saligna]|uniref:Uncharacterized protein n=1 Tax=Lactuca saligna TaxID=75948 RepID=A0AA35ZM73_LACSI|nr:unnamed protein product [Lactuca saligna]
MEATSSKRPRQTKSSARRRKPRSPSPPSRSPSPPSRSPTPPADPSHFGAVAHRIIASLVAPREERSTITALELKILYAMTHPENNLIPHYGRFLCHKLIRLSASRSGKIVCGGIVSMLAKSAHIRAPYPGPHQPLPGEPYLTTTVLESMRLFRSAGDGTHHWTVGQNHDPKLLITPENKGILDFRNPIHMTDCEENEEDGDDDEEKEEPHHASPTDGGSSSHFAAPPPYHQQYMDEFQSIHTRLDTYQQDITSLTKNFSTFTTQYARDQERQRKHEEDFWAWTRNPNYYPPPF